MIRVTALAVLALSFSCASAADLISTGQPDEAQVRQYAEDGVQTVIDLRSSRENRGMDEEKVVTDAGMTYVPFPIAGRADVSFENARKLDALLAEVEGPVVLHCASGNRVGALLALRASLNGASDQEATRVGIENGLTSLRTRVEELLVEHE